MEPTSGFYTGFVLVMSDVQYELSIFICLSRYVTNVEVESFTKDTVRELDCR